MKFGEIYVMDFAGTEGSETKGSHSWVCVSPQPFHNGHAFVGPLLRWRSRYEDYVYLVPIEPTRENNLDQVRAVDISNMKAIDPIARKWRRQGFIPKTEMKEVLEAIRFVFN